MNYIIYVLIYSANRCRMKKWLLIIVALIITTIAMTSAGRMSGNNNLYDLKKKKMEKKIKEIDGLKMAYIETGTGDPIVFLHGNPTSSYIWRNIIPLLEGQGRCIAPDLIGMGDSDKLPDNVPYSFEENQKYLEKLLEKLNVKNNIIFIVHDWGGALAFDWSRRHPEAVKGIAYMESVVGPRYWNEMPMPARQLFQDLRSEKGENMVLEQNLFIEMILPKSILREMSAEEMNQYRRPFLRPGSDRKAMLSWVRQLPIDGEPKNIVKIVNENSDFMAKSTIPKLFIEAVPGTLSQDEKNICNTWSNQTKMAVKGHHHLQEDSPVEIGEAISTWIKHLNR